MVDCLIYFVVFTIVFLLNFLAMRQPRVGVRSFLVVVSFMTLLLFIGFRYNVGTDYEHYLNDYYDISGIPWGDLPALRMELLVAVIFKLCSFVLPDARLLFVVLGFLLLWPIYKVNKLYDYRYLAYSILIYCILFLPFGLNGIRQGIAMGFMLLAFVYLIKNKVKYGMANFIIAVLFHTSSLIALPYMVAICFSKWRKISFTKLNIVLTGLIAVMVLFFLSSLLINSGFMQYDYILGNVDADRISLNSFVAYIPIVILIFAFSGGKTERDEILILKNLTVSGVVFNTVGTAAQYLSRFGLFFLMPSIILLPRLVQSISKKNTRIVVKCLLIIYLIGFFYVQYSLWGRHEILPYQTWILEGYM